MSRDTPRADRPGLRLALRLLAALLTLGSLAWVFWLLGRAWPELAAHRGQIRTWPLLAGFLLVVAASWLSFEAFVALVRALQVSHLPRPQLAHLHYTSQLLRHLPGRVWGLGYQWMASGRGGSLGNWVLVNIGHLALATFFALWSAGLVLALPHGVFTGALTVAVGIAGYVAAWWLLSSRRLGRLLAGLPGRLGSLTRRVPELLAGTPGPARLRIFQLLSVSWLFYYAGWALYGLSYPPLGAAGGVQLCAWYMLAWFVGYISVLTPSGLGVRELVFVWLAKDFPADVVALMAIVGRASQLSVDLLMGLMFASCVPRDSDRQGRGGSVRGGIDVRSADTA